MIEEEEETIKGYEKVTTDMFSITFSQQRENLNAIFASKKLESSKEIVNAVANMTINNVGYELNAAIVSDAQVEFVSNLDGITCTKNGITHQNLLGSRMINIQHEEFSVLPPLADTRIGENNQPALFISTGTVQSPHTLKSLAIQEIAADADLNNMGPNKTLRQVSSTGIDVTTPVELLPKIPVELVEPVLPHPLVASGALQLAIYANPLTRISGSLMNLTQSLIEISPMI